MPPIHLCADRKVTMTTAESRDLHGSGSPSCANARLRRMASRLWTPTSTIVSPKLAEEIGKELGMLKAYKQYFRHQLTDMIAEAPPAT